MITGLLPRSINRLIMISFGRRSHEVDSPAPWCRSRAMMPFYDSGRRRGGIADGKRLSQVSASQAATCAQRENQTTSCDSAWSRQVEQTYQCSSNSFWSLPRTRVCSTCKSPSILVWESSLFIRPWSGRNPQDWPHGVRRSSTAHRVAVVQRRALRRCVVSWDARRRPIAPRRLRRGALQIVPLARFDARGVVPRVDEARWSSLPSSS